MKVKGYLPGGLASRALAHLSPPLRNRNGGRDPCPRSQRQLEPRQPVPRPELCTRLLSWIWYNFFITPSTQALVGYEVRLLICLLHLKNQEMEEDRKSREPQRLNVALGWFVERNVEEL